mgnify:CR=1 FL=1
MAGGQEYFSTALNQLFDRAAKEAQTIKDEYISVEHLLIAATETEDRQLTALFKKYNIGIGIAAKNKINSHTLICKILLICSLTIRNTG